ncbi:CbiX/SirB N-terminal domain-containing protein [Corynebacterium stationis]|jgi:sirohydrochlorin cobaltochelatase|uniref:sirohydrochlorin chelatase n=1 Tax=Corynebacterium stationis TaxID=1705 RepID=UPI00273BCDFA|nr:CbiX/SirB N-terminal domain-containing protein [Corynebacterium stationis]WLP86068.1 CbiX/SirB N-terminal domain-containing protein [Corynebacterium stationis]
MSQAFIALSHGSRHPQAAVGIDKLVARTSSVTGAFGQAAHLEFDTPSLVDAAVSLKERGFERATLMPLLFTNGFHMRYDVPNVVAEAQRISGVKLHPTAGLGTGTEVLEQLRTRLFQDVAAGDNPHVILYAVGSSNVAANEAVVRLGVRLADATGFQTSTLFATPGAGRAGFLWGNKGLRLQATAHSRIHLLPLFVTQGLLLDSANTAMAEIMHITGSQITSSAPLGSQLAEILAHRLSHAQRTEVASPAQVPQTT